jgi:hypothetical protein
VIIVIEIIFNFIIIIKNKMNDKKMNDMESMDSAMDKKME